MPIQIYHNTGDDDYFDCTTSRYNAQTFTTVGAFSIAQVKLKGYRLSTPGNLQVGIYAVDGSSKPTGSALTTGAVSVDSITESVPGEWVTVSLTPYALSATTKYAIVANVSNGLAATRTFNWRMDTSTGFADGGAHQTDSFPTWPSAESGSVDLMFEAYTVESSASPSVSPSASISPSISPSVSPSSSISPSTSPSISPSQSASPSISPSSSPSASPSASPSPSPATWTARTKPTTTWTRVR